MLKMKMRQWFNKETLENKSKYKNQVKQNGGKHYADRKERIAQKVQGCH